MTSKQSYKKRLIMLIVMVCSLVPLGSAFADCRVQSSNGSDDIVVCANPADTDGIRTGGGNDNVTVNADTEVRGDRAIDTGTGHDTVTNRGTARGNTAAIFFDQGSDTLHNYGTITSGDHAARCFPQSGQTCTLNNYATINVSGEAFDIVSSSGRTVITNSGTITSSTQEAVHGHGYGTFEVTNTNTMTTRRQSVEVYYGTGIIVNRGSMSATDFATIDTDRGNDQITNSGSLRSERAPVIETAGGNDVIRHSGNATSRNSSSGGGVIDAGSGNDNITVSGSLTEVGSGYAAIKAGSGSDTVIIEGGAYNRVIDGGSESDTLTFRFSGSQGEIDAFRASMNGKSPSGGSVTWRGQTYRWQAFERITLELTGGSSAPAPTQPPSGSALGIGTHQESHSGISYSGNWEHMNDAGAHSGAFRRSLDPNAQATFSFTGSKFTLITLTFSNRGSMEICIDTTNCRTVNMYSQNLVWQYPVVFTVSSGTHTVRIRNVSNAYIDIDAVKIE